MTQERAPEHTESLLGSEAGTTSWEMARERLANPEQPRTYWLATTRPDGRPHLMPVIAFWIDDAHARRGGGGDAEGTQHRRRRSLRHRDGQHDAPFARYRHRGSRRSAH